jgi:hypothetical protein
VLAQGDGLLLGIRAATTEERIPVPYCMTVALLRVRSPIMLKKKTEKALKAIEKDVKKALHKGATETGVDNAVDRAKKKTADKEAKKKRKSGKSQKKAKPATRTAD